MEELLVPAMAFLFALLFYATGQQKQCSYRRYIIPIMLIAIALLYLNSLLGFSLLVISASLVYYGYKGYGRKLLEEKKEES